MAAEKNEYTVLISEEEISRRVKELGKQISTEYLGKEILLICTLKGAVIFSSDLARKISVPCELGFVKAKSYAGDHTTGSVDISFEDIPDIKGRHIIIVEDIIDTGLTLKRLSEYFLAKGPASMKICAFLDKPSRRKVGIKADYVGFKIEDHFVVGYGLDHNERFRNLPFIARLDQ